MRLRLLVSHFLRIGRQITPPAPKRRAVRKISPAELRGFLLSDKSQKTTKKMTIRA